MHHFSKSPVQKAKSVMSSGMVDGSVLETKGGLPVDKLHYDGRPLCRMFEKATQEDQIDLAGGYPPTLKKGKKKTTPVRKSTVVTGSVQE